MLESARDSLIIHIHLYAPNIGSPPSSDKEITHFEIGPIEFNNFGWTLLKFYFDEPFPCKRNLIYP